MYIQKADMRDGVMYIGLLVQGWVGWCSLFSNVANDHLKGLVSYEWELASN